MSDASPTPSPRPAPSAKFTRAELAPSAPKGWRRFSPLAFSETDEGGLQVRVAGPRAVAYALALLVLGWLGLATAAYLFVKYKRDFPEVRFSDMLLFPVRQKEYRTARGDYLVEEAKKQLKAKDSAEAFHSLRVAATLSPDNRDGRMLLSQFYVVCQRPDLAQKHLIDGLKLHSGDHEYLQAVFSFLLQRQADFEVLKIADDLLARAGPSPAIDNQLRLVGMARATALFFRGNYDAAEDALQKFELGSTTDGQILAIRIDWERGERETALIRLESLSEQSPDSEQVYSQYAACLREAGRIDELRRLALLRHLSYPERPRALIDLLYIYDNGKNEASVQTGVADIFRDFSDNEEVLFSLADFAANTGRPALARRIYEHCKAADLPWDGAALLTVEAHVVSKQYREALATANAMLKENPEWGKRFSSIFNGLQAIAHYGLADEEAADLFLTNFINQAEIRADNLVAVSNRLVSVSAKSQARQLLAKAVFADPLNQSALTSLIQLDLDAGRADSLAIHLRTLLAMRKPSRVLLREAYDKLASDRFMLTPERASLLDELNKALQSALSTAPEANFTQKVAGA